MNSKKVSLILSDCYATVDMDNHGDDMVSFAVTELEIDQEKSTSEVTHHKRISTTEIYLGLDDVQDLIEALSYIVPKEVI